MQAHLARLVDSGLLLADVADEAGVPRSCALPAGMRESDPPVSCTVIAEALSSAPEHDRSGLSPE